MYEVNHNLALFEFFFEATFHNTPPPLGGLSASPDPSDQGESYALSPLDPSLRGDS